MKILKLFGLAALVYLLPATTTYAQGSDNENPDLPDNSKSESIDSLLSIFYIQRSMNDSAIYPEIDSMDIAADLSDAVYIERLSKIASPVHLSYNKQIRNCIITYTQKYKEKSEAILGLAEYYMPIFEEIFDQYGLPHELKGMAVIESALNPLAVSRAGATGMWQFMYRTGKHYNLNVTSFVDDRRNPVASAHAAAQYLRDLHSVFGDWNLAIAAYNCGEGNVRKAIRRANGKTDYWEIYPYLPRETRGYVPLFVGATYMLHYHKEHGLVPLKTDKPIQTDTIMVSRMLHFEQIAALTDISVQQLRDLNPQYRRDIIPGKEKLYVLTLPYEYTTTFIDKESEIYSYKDSTYFNPKVLAAPSDYTVASADGKTKIVHRVVKGDTPGGIAQRYKVKLSDLKYWNNIGSKNIIRIGQKLVVYK
jgi:membrane-bound lytic murein transglycosylase D